MNPLFLEKKSNDVFEGSCKVCLPLDTEIQSIPQRSSSSIAKFIIGGPASTNSPLAKKALPDKLMTAN